MQIFQVACVSCGGPISVPPDVDHLTCAYCGAGLIVQRGEGYVALKLAEQITKSIQEVGSQTQSTIREGTQVTQEELKRLQLSQEASALQMQLTTVQSEIRTLERAKPNKQIKQQLSELRNQQRAILARLRYVQGLLAPPVPSGVRTAQTVGRKPDGRLVWSCLSAGLVFLALSFLCGMPAMAVNRAIFKSPDQSYGPVFLIAALFIFIVVLLFFVYMMNPDDVMWKSLKGFLTSKLPTKKPKQPSEGLQSPTGNLTSKSPIEKPKQPSEGLQSPTGDFMSKSPAEKPKQPSKRLKIILGIIGGLAALFICVCVGLFLLYKLGVSTPGYQATTTARAIARGTAKAITQVTEVARPTNILLTTGTSIPTGTQTPSNILSPTKAYSQTNTLEPTFIPPTSTIVYSPTPFPKNVTAFLDCLPCAQQPGWRINLRSKPGKNAGKVIDYLRHGDHVNINNSVWVDNEHSWWYLVEGDNSYETTGRIATGWISGEKVTVDPPQTYPLGTAWTDFFAGIKFGYGVNIWSKPGYANLGGGGPIVGELKIGSQIKIIDKQWDEPSEYWFYKVVGIDKNTGETITGWLDGTFIVLTHP